MLQGSGINSEAAPNIRALQWSKFAAWTAGMPLAVTMRLESHKFFSDRDCALIFVRILCEVGNIAAEKNIPLVDRGPFLVEAKKLGVPIPTVEVYYSIVSGINRNI
jgi:ketopantoate reductase